MNKKKLLSDLLNFDSLAEAERMSGKSYKTDDDTTKLGMGLMIANSQVKEKLLDSMGDSKFSNTEDDYLAIVQSIGFEVVLKEPFINENGIEERLYILWNDEHGILLKFDTHTWGDDGSWAKNGKEVPPPSVNGGVFYYNWSQTTELNGLTSSGSYVGNGDEHRSYSTFFNKDVTPHFLPKELRDIEPQWGDKPYEEYNVEFKEWCDKVHEYVEGKDLIKIWCGSHDCREAVKFHVSQLAENGIFHKKWVKRPFLWLLSYMDSKVEGYDHEAITNERIAKLPQYVQDAITPKEK